MIEINLVPDVKQELIRAERIRSIVISMTILVGMIAAGLVVLLVVWVFGIQAARGAFVDRKIETESATLSAVEDLESSLTIQNQLNTLPALHESKQVSARIFDVLRAINPPAPNEVSISKLTINAEDKMIAIEAQAAGGYPALEVFKKTILATNLEYAGIDNSQEVRPLAVDVNDGDRSYGEDASGKKVLRFALTFQYPDELFTPYLKDARIAGPTQKINVTDSHLGVPKSLFAPKANDSEGEDS
jgi:hypothetical protein